MNPFAIYGRREERVKPERPNLSPTATTPGAGGVQARWSAALGDDRNRSLTRIGAGWPVGWRARSLRHAATGSRGGTRRAAAARARPTDERHERVAPALREIRRHQRDARQQRRPRPQDDDRSPRSVTEAHESVMEVARVGLMPTLPFDHASQEREHGVEDRDAEDQDRDQQRTEEEERVAREGVVGPSADRDRRDREQHAQEESTRVAHHDLRRMPVERQEAEAHTDRDDRDERPDVRTVDEVLLEQPVGEQEQCAAARSRRCRRPDRRVRR